MGSSLNLAALDLLSMHLVVLCADLGSLSAAARQAHCSTSTGSYRLAALEQALKARLFDRNASGLKITHAGRVFVRHARIVLTEIHELNHQVALGAGPQSA